MSTPFDKAIAAIAGAGYHNHRLETHSDTVSDALFDDLVATCAPLRDDVANGVVKVWKNVSAPGDRLRKVDLFVGEPDSEGRPDIHAVRIAVENKSVITAHRNRTNRFDDLKKVLSAVHTARPEALLIATVLVGMAERVLNVPDRCIRFIVHGRTSSPAWFFPACLPETLRSGTSSDGRSAETRLRIPRARSSCSAPFQPDGRGIRMWKDTMRSCSSRCS